LKTARREYEDKIRRLEIENNELLTLRVQYANCLKDGEYYKKELSKYTNELNDLRKMKVQLTRELRQESTRHKQIEQAKSREIATLKRVKPNETRFVCCFNFEYFQTQMQKENEIRTLKAQHKQKEMILKRKQEEVNRIQRRTIRMLFCFFVISGTFTTTTNANGSNAKNQQGNEQTFRRHSTRRRGNERLGGFSMFVCFVISDCTCNSSTKTDLSYQS